MPITYQTQLVVHAPNGSRLGILPDVSAFTATSPFNDASSLQFSYPKTGRNAALLTDAANGFFEIALEVDNGSGYYEPDNSRFVNLGREDEGSNGASEMSFQMPGYAWLLQTGQVGTNGLNKEGVRAFSNAKAGTVLTTLINEAKARGSLPGLATSFSASGPSAGGAWSKTFSTDYDPGTDLMTILRALADDGLCDWKMSGRTLVVNNADTGFVDRSSTVVLRYGQDIADGPNKVDATNLVHRVTVQGEETRRVTRTQVAGSPQPWGSFESYVDAGGVTDVGSLNQIGDAALTAGVMPAMQFTRTVELEDTQFAPHQHYRVGDWVSAPGLNGHAIEKLRVREIAISKSAAGLQAVLVLNDRLTENSVKLARKTNALKRGSGVPRGTGKSPNPNDKRRPAAPVGLDLGVDYFINDAGDDQGIVILAWQPVLTEEGGGGSIGIRQYNVWQRPNAVDSVVWQRAGSTQDPDTEITLSPFQVNTNWQFRVTAVAENGVEGPSSAIIGATVVADNVPPPVPSAPALSARLGVLLISWDGRGVGNVPMPKDFNVTEVHVSATNNFTPSSSTLVDLLAGKGMVPITNLPYNSTRYVKFVAVDRRANRSAASAQTAGLVTPLVDTDLIGKILDGANLIDYSVDGTKSIAAGSIDTTRLRVGQVNQIADFRFTDADLNALRKARATVPANVTFTPPNTTDNLDGRVDIDGRTAATSVYFLAPGADTEWDSFPLEGGETYVVNFNFTPILGTLTAGAVVMNYRNANGTSGVTIIASLVGKVAGSYVFDWTPPDTARFGTLKVQLVTGGVVRIAKPGVRRKVPGVLIEDGAITAAKVAALAIEAGSIAANAITADKIVAGAITGIKISATAIDGKTITGATIRTAASGARVQIDTGGVKQVNSSNIVVSQITPTSFLFRSATSGARAEFDLSGMRLYNSSGINTVNLAAGSGEGMVTGIFRTAPAASFPRVEINNSLWANAFSGIRFYSVAGHQGDPEIKAQGIGAGEIFKQGSLILSSGEVVNTGPGRTGHAELQLETHGDFYLGRISGTGQDIVNIHSDTDGKGNLVLQSGSGSIILSGGYTRLLNFPQSTASPNMGIGSNNVLTNMTSLGKFKINQEPIGVHYELLDAVPKTWTDKNEQAANPDEARRYAGFVAEEILALSEEHGNAFDSLLTYSDSYDLQGLQYERFTAFLLPVVRDMAARIKKLEEAQA